MERRDVLKEVEEERWSVGRGRRDSEQIFLLLPASFLTAVGLLLDCCCCCCCCFIDGCMDNNNVVSSLSTDGCCFFLALPAARSASSSSDLLLCLLAAVVVVVAAAAAADIFRTTKLLSSSLSSSKEDESSFIEIIIGVCLNCALYGWRDFLCHDLSVMIFHLSSFTWRRGFFETDVSSFCRIKKNDMARKTFSRVDFNCIVVVVVEVEVLPIT